MPSLRRRRARNDSSADPKGVFGVALAWLETPITMQQRTVRFSQSPSLQTTTL